MIVDIGQIENCFNIKCIRESWAAKLYFAHKMNTSYDLVLKVLYFNKNDSRAAFTLLSERQACQIEAMYWNAQFTSNVYLGLASLLYCDEKLICIGKIIYEAEKANELLDATKEYVLIMRALPDEHRLDWILSHASHSQIYPLLDRLINRIIYIHANIAIAPVNTSQQNQDGMIYGSYEQLRAKLEHNFTFLNEVMHMDGDHYDLLCHCLIDSLKIMIDHPDSKKYFEQRLHHQYIKRCHGDLKSSNIWLDNPTDTTDDGGVKILDVIDFNDNYYYIDVLSDFAMLVIDIELLTHSSLYSDYMMESYLQRSQQTDDISQLILAYYLTEKAIVRSVVNILYDNQPDVGLEFLYLASQHLIKLNTLLSLSPF